MASAASTLDSVQSTNSHSSTVPEPEPLEAIDGGSNDKGSISEELLKIYSGINSEDCETYLTEQQKQIVECDPGGEAGVPYSVAICIQDVYSGINSKVCAEYFREGINSEACEEYLKARLEKHQASENDFTSHCDPQSVKEQDYSDINSEACKEYVNARCEKLEQGSEDHSNLDRDPQGGPVASISPQKQDYSGLHLEGFKKYLTARRTERERAAALRSSSVRTTSGAGSGEPKGTLQKLHDREDELWFVPRVGRRVDGPTFLSHSSLDHDDR